MNAENDLRLLMEELVDLFDWEDKTPLNAILHVRNAVLNLRADLAVEKARAEKAEANYAFMVKRAADQNLDGYRELGARCAKLEAERDEARSKLRAYETAPIHMEAHVLRARLRETAQILIEAVGADGPMDAEDAARKAVKQIEAFRGSESQPEATPLIMDSTPRKNPSKIEFLWFQCSQCGWGEEDRAGDWTDGAACPHCGIGPIRSSRMGCGK